MRRTNGWDLQFYMPQGCFDGFANCIRQIIVVPNLFLACFELNNMGYTLARQHAYRNAQPTSHETFLLPSLGELELKSLWSRTNSCFPASQIFLVFLLQKSVPSQSLRTCRSLQNIGVIFWRFAGERSSAKRPKNCACSAGYHHYKPQILHVNGRTAKASSWEPFHAIWHVEIALVIENSDLSYLHVLMHVVTVGDVRCDWLKCNAIRMIKVQREQ